LSADEASGASVSSLFVDSFVDLSAVTSSGGRAGNNLPGQFDYDPESAFEAIPDPGASSNPASPQSGVAVSALLTTQVNLDDLGIPAPDDLPALRPFILLPAPKR
jgi:hypothetical protein